MKKFITLLLVFFASLNLNSQAFTAVKIKVNDGARGSVAELIEDHYKSYKESDYKGNIKFVEENELDILGNYKIRGYPTILTLKGGDSEFKEFYQGRDIKSFENFIFN